MTMPREDMTVLIMAAGTGGHVFPALSIARKLRKHNVRTEWMGTHQGMENQLLEGTGIKIHAVSAKGLKGKGVVRLLFAPFMLVQALIQSIRVLSSVNPDCVLGMGGFVSGPGGLAAKITGRKLVIHEQNAVPGFTNKLLSKIANLVFEAFPNTFPDSDKVLYTGNPLRSEIAELAEKPRQYEKSSRSLRILVLGGSQGALAINEVVPELIADWPEQNRPHVLHQSGERTLEETQVLYKDRGLSSVEGVEVVPFISNMADAYGWADLVICRSGASTVSEIAAVGLPSILIPYPHHSDQQQKHNANWLVSAGAAFLLEQKDLTLATLRSLLLDLHTDRSKLQKMSDAARSISICDADELIVSRCMELAHA
ncbi:undecaprenyldiphospho-muramoylpentapeptide beta-N-acetylglucosaminyltransferase [Gammaproteobacteria bacterium]|jgi:UDP-N-acetylglucosamine--N-acetylmuramyl-(pentapeptide) pyrophosphoryl-undecaprenol N-acetylglucosamine transferase|nr:undecaprenyldiphospho-muramoylpentapeptide beta-N-acetylglucosaminyltransferase [Gammaproteobacteria bacterium]MDC3196427.1 undecaprenyldiphospho-muramoylpentapeptide beta-N-acetylglucosaminyltransferase [Gammaproteobacteria bacterium]